MRVTTQLEYAALALVQVINHEREHRTPLSVSRIAKRAGLSRDYVEQLLLRLRRAGLVRSTRGVQGGYQMARMPSQVTIRDLYKVVVGDGIKVPPSMPNACDEVWDELEQAILNTLGEFNLRSLARKQRKIDEG